MILNNSVAAPLVCSEIFSKVEQPEGAVATECHPYNAVKSTLLGSVR
jgi:hypothetical protein